MDLLKRREEVLAGNRKAYETRHSGWHPGDPGSEARDHETKLPERPIVLQHRSEMYVVGPDVLTIKAALGGFMDKLARAKTKAKTEGWPEPDLLGFGRTYQEGALLAADKALQANGQITLSTQEWNWANTILGYMKVLVSSATAEVQNYDDV